MIGLCTDSNSQLPDDLARLLDVEVVPLTVSIDGEEFLEGVDLDADGFWARFESGTPTVSTAAPGPGQFAATYARLAEGGAEAILSVHVGSAISGTFNAARLAAEAAPVPVHLVDTGTASFAVGCAVWGAADAIEAGAGIEDAAAVAERIGASCGNVFVVGTLELARAGGRLAPGATDGPGLTVLSLRGDAMETLGSEPHAEAAAERMAEEILASGPHLRVGVGSSDPSSLPVAAALAALLRERGPALEVVGYRVGASVGAHTGPGTAGAVYHPLG